MPGPGVIRTALLESDADSARWPSDKEFRTALREAPIYRTITRSRLRTILEVLELQLHSELSERLQIMEKLTIEHIMPQEWADCWPLPTKAGEAEVEVREAAIHRLGNLTLLTKKLNPKLFNGPWEEKRKAIGKCCRLNLSANLAALPDWNEGTIEEWGELLVKAAQELWPRPKA
jgi:hypothetical protein